MARFRLASVVAVICLAGSMAQAELPPQSQDDATHVVIGEVEAVYVQDSREYRRYVVKIRIEKLERGEGYEPGGVYYAECFQRKKTAPRIPAPYGHTAVPREGQKIRAWIISEGDGNQGIYKDWFVVL